MLLVEPGRLMSFPRAWSARPHEGPLKVGSDGGNLRGYRDASRGTPFGELGGELVDALSEFTATMDADDTVSAHATPSTRTALGEYTHAGVSGFGEFRLDWDGTAYRGNVPGLAEHLDFHLDGYLWLTLR